MLAKQRAGFTLAVFASPADAVGSWAQRRAPPAFHREAGNLECAVLCLTDSFKQKRRAACMQAAFSARNTANVYPKPA